MDFRSMRLAGPDAIEVVVRGRRPFIVHREDADPEHRFAVYRAAAALFGNQPQRPDPLPTTKEVAR